MSPVARRMIAAVVCAVGGFVWSTTRADPPVTGRASPPSLLEQISQDTRRLYAKARSGMVRVQLPTPDWLERINEQKRLAEAQQQFMSKWGSSMDPTIRERLEQQQKKALTGRGAESRPIDLTADPGPVDDPLVLLAVGVRVDRGGHVVLPVYVDPRSLPKATRAFTGDGRTTYATLVASDARTNLSVFKLADVDGEPVALGSTKPDDGGLALVVSADTGARLVVWTPLHAEHGIVLGPDGTMSGFAFDDGHFLSAPTFMPVVRQMIETGRVRRAVLGVMAHEVVKDDSLRRGYPALGDSPAIQVTLVEPGSAAEACGLKPNDLILEVAGQSVGDAPTFAAVIAASNGPTKLLVLRGDERVELSVDLRPRDGSENPVTKSQNPAKTQ